MVMGNAMVMAMRRRTIPMGIALVMDMMVTTMRI